MSATDARRYLQSCDPESVLAADDFQEYKRRLEGVWPHLKVLNANIYLLSRLMGFPFEFLGVSPRPCWNIIQRALMDGCVLAIWRIALDSQSNGCTLLHVKNFLLSKLDDPQAKRFLAEEMRRLSPGEWKTTWGMKTEEIRHNYLAHYDLQKLNSPSKEQIEARSLTFMEIEKARDKITELFDALSFRVRYGSIPLEYHPGVVIASQKDKRTDIEIILDMQAKESYLVNLPETNPIYWQHELSRMSPDDREKLNEYRRKFDLPMI